MRSEQEKGEKKMRKGKERDKDRRKGKERERKRSRFGPLSLLLWFGFGQPCEP